MPLPNITPQDFTGATAIATDRFTSSMLQSYIDEWLPIYLRRLVGDDVANEIATLDPLPQKYIDLLGGVVWEDERVREGYTRQNTGLTRVLIFCLYFEYVRRQPRMNSIVGTVTNKNENSLPTSAVVAGVQAIQRLANGYEEFNKNVIPFLDYYRVLTERVTLSVENAGVYTLTVNATTYLSDNETVYVNSIEYTATNITNNTFDISAVSGLDFTNKQVIWKPFYNACYREQFASLL